MYGQAADVGAAHAAGIGVAARRQHIHKRFVPVALFIQPLQVSAAVPQAGVQGSVYAPDQGQQVRHEDQAHGRAVQHLQLLPDLRQVAMPRRGVGGEGIGRLAELGAQVLFPAGAADPGLGVRDQALRVHQSGLQQGQKAQRHRGGIATRVGHQLRAGNRLAVHFRQAVHRLVQQCRAGVFAPVPLRPERGIPETEIRRQVHHPGAGLQQRGHLLHGGAVGRAEEHQVAAAQQPVIRFAVDQLDLAAQGGEYLADRLAGLGA